MDVPMKVSGDSWEARFFRQNCANRKTQFQILRLTDLSSDRIPGSPAMVFTQPPVH
jgi:hypothetical protein